MNLTSGAIDKIVQGEGDKLHPVLQVLEIRQASIQNGTKERYWILLSDGIHHQQGVLATQVNCFVKSGQLQNGSIVQLNQFMYNIITSRRIIIVISLQVLVEKAGMIGDPKNYDAFNPMPQNHPELASGPSQLGLSIDNVQPYDGSFTDGSPPMSTSNSSILPSITDFTSGNFMESNQLGGLQQKSEVERSIAPVNLTSGAVEYISQGVGDKLQPVLQLLEIRQVNTQDSTSERYRIILSDGIHFLQGMLGTQLNCFVKSGQLKKGSIFQLCEFMCITIQKRRIVIIIKLQVLFENAEAIGDPRSYDELNPIPQDHLMGQPGLSLDNPQHQGGSQALGPDAGQHAIEDSSLETKFSDLSV